MVSLLYGLCYGELAWYVIERRKAPLKIVQFHCWFVIILNFTLAMFVQSIVNLEISIVILCYVLVIFNLRTSKNGQPKT